MLALSQAIILSIISFYCGLLLAPFLLPKAYQELYINKNSRGPCESMEKRCPDVKCPAITETLSCPKCPVVPTQHCPEVKCPENKMVPFNGQEKRCISFTLYPLNGILGDTHSFGLIHQIKLAKILYPKWRIKLFLSDELKNSSFCQKLSSSNDSAIVDVIWKSDTGKGHYGHFWRFLVADDAECDRWIVRDVDCRFTIREMQAVHDWINSGKSFHIMRDAQNHDGEILAGLFGGTSKSLKGKKNVRAHSRVFY